MGTERTAEEQLLWDIFTGVAEQDRIKQSNEVASLIAEKLAKTNPEFFVTLNLRYNLADALWDAGYRKVEAE